MSDIEIHGNWDDRFASLVDAIEDGIRDGKELGLSFAVMVDGDYAVDLWAGHMDRARTRPWQRDTLCFIASTAKIPVALAILILVDRGQIDLDAPVAKYWPGFAENGKENVRVRHIMSHVGGIPGISSLVGPSAYFDWDTVIARIEDEPLWFEPGTRSAYHGLTFGFILGKIVWEVTGMPISEFVYQEVCQKVDAEYYMPLPESARDRLAEIELVTGETQGNLSVDASQSEVFGSFAANIAETVQLPGFQQSLNPGGVAFSNAQNLVKIGDILACRGTSHGVNFLSAATAALASEEQNYFHDDVLGSPARLSMGFGLASKEIPIPFEKAFHWGGYGGSSMVMIPELKASISYVPNQFYGGHGEDSRTSHYGAHVMLQLLKMA